MDEKDKDYTTPQDMNESEQSPKGDLLCDDLHLEDRPAYDPELGGEEEANQPSSENIVNFADEEHSNYEENSDDEIKEQTSSENGEEETPSEQEPEKKTYNYSPSEEDTPVIDENAPVPSAEEMQEALKPKLKEKTTKKKRIIIATVAVFLVIAITLSIALPIYFVNKDKIFVKSAEDFLNYNDGTYFVLKNDIVVEGDLTIDRDYNIDLAGHSLVVNGTFTYTTGKEANVYIGTKKGKEYTQSGLLQAKNFVIDAVSSTVNLMSSLTVDTMTANAKELNLPSSLQANGTVDVTAQKFNVSGNMSFGTGEAANLTVRNCPEFNLSSDVASSVMLYGTTLRMESNAKVNELVFRDDSRSVVFGEIRNSASSEIQKQETPEQPAAEITTGDDRVGTLVLLGSYSCPTVRNVKTVAMERKNGVSINVYNCATVKYIDRLQTPVDVNVDEREDGTLMAVAANVQNAQSYMFRIDGNEWVDNATNEFNITAQLTSQTGSHNIEVYAKGNFSYDNPFALDAEKLYLDSTPIKCEYTYQIQLATPSNLRVTVNTTAEGTSYILSFDRVAFATKYSYAINGTTYEYKPENLEEARINIDITDKLTTAGAYSIRIIAKADSADILQSKAAMTSTIKEQKLDTPTVSAMMDESGTTVTLTLSTTEGVNTTYLVTYTVTDAEGQAKQITLVTTNTTLSLSGLKAGDTITVIAQANGYYTESDPATATVSAYVAPQQ